MTLPADIDGPGLLRRRAVAVDAVSEKEGILTGRAVPYGVTVELAPGFSERFERGAFAAQAKAVDQHARVRLLYAHDATIVPLGRAVELAEADDGLHVSFRMNRRLIDEPGSVARQVWLSILEGDLTDLSVGFQAKQTKTVRDGDRVLAIRRRAHLAEVSVVPYGAYGPAAQLTGVRDQTVDDEAWREQWRTRIVALR
jgi:HK97 family phage prohead protease